MQNRIKADATPLTRQCNTIDARPVKKLFGNSKQASPRVISKGGEVITSSEDGGTMDHGEFSVDLGAHPPYHPAPEGFRFSGSDSSSDADSIMTSGSTSGGSGSGSAGAGSMGLPQDLVDKNLNIT